jgi:hypothetical protein
MKRISIVFILALTLLVSVQSQTRQSVSLNKVQVTAQTIINQQAGKPYVIDLSRKGTVYNVASGVDYSRIQLRNSAGKLITLTDLFNKAGSRAKNLAANKTLVFGAVSDLRAMVSGGSGIATRPNQIIACDGRVCICTGDDDCNILMSPGGGCPEGSWVYCSGSGSSAFCVCVRQ